MRRFLAAAAAVLLSGVCCASAQAGIATPLTNSGRFLVDKNGRVEILHGLNMVYKRAPYAPDAIGFGEDDAAFLQSEGYNTVRLGLIYKAVEPAPGSYDDAYLQRIENTVNMLGKHGIVSLLDFHQDLYNERFQGEGWPDWAVQDDGLPNQPQAGFPANYLVMPALQHAFDHFWANDPGPGGVGLQDRYAAAWAHVAARFKDNPNVLGYDLLNEPWPGSTWQQCATPTGCPVFDATMSAFIKRTMTAIRAVDPTTIIWYEPNPLFNNGADTNLDAFGDKHAGMSWHDYCLTANEGGGGYGPDCQASDTLVFGNAVKRSTNTGDALLLSEFGATDDPAALEGVLKLADQNMMSWQEWHYCGCDDPTTTGEGDKQAIVLDPAKPPSGENLKSVTLNAITRPYPQAIAGTPFDWSFDPASKRFAMNYSTAKLADPNATFGPGTDTEIAVPERQYPDGYSVSVQGGGIRSAPGARVLKIAACTATDRMGVTIQPGKSVSQSSCAPPPKPGVAPKRLKLSVKPRRARLGRLVKVRVRVRAGKSPVRGAKVRVGRRRAHTNKNGVARLRVRFTKAGKRRVEAHARGYKPGHAKIRVRRR